MNTKNSSWRARERAGSLRTATGGHRGLDRMVFAHGHWMGTGFCRMGTLTGVRPRERSLRGGVARALGCGEAMDTVDLVDHMDEGLRLDRCQRAACRAPACRRSEAMVPRAAGRFAGRDLMSAKRGRMTGCELPIGLGITRLISLDHAWSGLVTLSSGVFFCVCTRPPCGRPPQSGKRGGFNHRPRVRDRERVEHREKILGCFHTGTKLWHGAAFGWPRMRGGAHRPKRQRISAAVHSCFRKYYRGCFLITPSFLSMLPGEGCLYTSTIHTGHHGPPSLGSYGVAFCRRVQSGLQNGAKMPWLSIACHRLHTASYGYIRLHTDILRVFLLEHLHKCCGAAEAVFLAWGHEAISQIPAAALKNETIYGTERKKH
ncbi:MAG: hypothetical protein JWR26_2984 [Pedosphaera sp.]|nr:hypothetical protein [Pedosphaera sp.]